MYLFQTNQKYIFVWSLILFHRIIDPNYPIIFSSLKQNSRIKQTRNKVSNERKKIGADVEFRAIILRWNPDRGQEGHDSLSRKIHLCCRNIKEGELRSPYFLENSNFFQFLFLPSQLFAVYLHKFLDNSTIWLVPRFQISKFLTHMFNF